MGVTSVKGIAHIPDILGRRALPPRRLARLGATPDFHHGLFGTDPQGAPHQSRAPRSNRAHDAEQNETACRRDPVESRPAARARTGEDRSDKRSQRRRQLRWEVWIRDLNTFIDLALEVQPGDRLRQSLLTFLHFQGPDGNIVDGYVATESATGNYQCIGSATMPQFMGYKNTVETDQESSLVQAVHRYVQKTGDQAILEEPIDGVTVRDRLSRALEYPLQHRFSRKHGLIWGATTVDWGDVQPEHPWGVELDASSHRAIDVYDNAMFVIALNDYLDLTRGSGPAARWRKTASQFKARMREHLWDRWPPQVSTAHLSGWLAVPAGLRRTADPLSRGNGDRRRSRRAVGR